jgi:hypothetical protein
VNEPVPRRALPPTVTVKLPVTVTAAVPPRVPPESTRLGNDWAAAALKFRAPLLITSAVLFAVRLSGTFAFTVAPATVSVPAPLMSEPPFSVRVPPVKLSTVAAAIR